MGDTGGQSAEGGELELLGLLGDLRNIVEKNQGMAVFAALQGNKAGLQDAAVGGALQAAGAQAGIVLPLLHALDQLRAVRVEQLAGQLGMAEQVVGALVGQQHPVLLVQHQNAGAHALQDQGVQGFQVGHVGRPLFGQVLADLQAPGQALHEQGGGEAQRTEGADLHILGGGGRAAETEVEGQEDHADRRHRGYQQADTPAQEDIGDGHRHNQ